MASASAAVQARPGAERKHRRRQSGPPSGRRTSWRCQATRLAPIGTSCANDLANSAMPAHRPTSVGKTIRDSNDRGRHQSMMKKQANTQNVSGGFVR